MHNMTKISAVYIKEYVGTMTYNVIQMKDIMMLMQIK